MAQYPEAIAAPSLRNADEAQVRELLERVQPEVIVHTAAVSDIGQCARNPEESYCANVELPLLLARCNPGAKLILFSSDQVYSGCAEPGPYREDTVCPGNLYASQKLEMEERVAQLDGNAVFLRAEWMYDSPAPKGNYLLNVANAQGTLTFSSGQFRGVTFLREVAENMDAVIRLPGGAYNFGSETRQDMNRITRDFLAFLGKDNPVQDCPAPHNLWMDCSKAAALGVRFSTVEDGLRRAAVERGLKKNN